MEDLNKPIQPTEEIEESLEEKVARLEAENKVKDKEIEMLKEAVRLSDEQIEDLTEKAITDPLTGLRSRRAWNEELTLVFRHQKEGATEQRRESQEDDVCVIIIDIDKFKSVNDKHGHLAGDEVLKEVSKRLMGSIRESDMIARYGGEEISLLLVGISEFEAKRKVERLREAIEKESFYYGDIEIPITVSAGISFGNKTSDPNKLIKEADTALYYSKENGRNKVTEYSKELENKPQKP